MIDRALTEKLASLEEDAGVPGPDGLLPLLPLGGPAGLHRPVPHAGSCGGSRSSHINHNRFGIRFSRSQVCTTQVEIQFLFR